MLVCESKRKKKKREEDDEVVLLLVCEVSSWMRRTMSVDSKVYQRTEQANEATSQWRYDEEEEGKEDTYACTCILPTSYAVHSCDFVGVSE